MGGLDFVCAREEDRSLLMQYLDSRLAGRRVKFPLPLRRFRRLKLVWKNSTLHFDSKVWPRKKAKGENSEHHRNHGKTIGARDPATGTLSTNWRDRRPDPVTATAADSNSRHILA
jgi:hypothetical protein